MQKLVLCAILVLSLSTAQSAQANEILSTIFQISFKKDNPELPKKIKKAINQQPNRLQIVQAAIRDLSDYKFYIVYDKEDYYEKQNLNKQRHKEIILHLSKKLDRAPSPKSVYDLGQNIVNIAVQSKPAKNAWSCPWKARLHFPKKLGGGDVVFSIRDGIDIALAGGAKVTFEPDRPLNANVYVTVRSGGTGEYRKVSEQKKLEPGTEVSLHVSALPGTTDTKPRGSGNTPVSSSIGNAAVCRVSVSSAR